MSQTCHVVDDLFGALDVAKEHSGISPEAQVMGFTMYFQPSARGYLVLTDLIPYAITEDLCPATWQRVKARIFQSRDYFMRGAGGPAGQVVNLHGRQPLYADPRQDRLGHSKELFMVVQIERRMQASHNVQVGEAASRGVAQQFPGGFERHPVCLFMIFITPEGAKVALVFAQVGGIDVQTVNEIGLLSIQGNTPLIGPAHELRERSIAQQRKRLFF
jgi:hypothetical protein